uniref:ZF(U1like)-1 Zn-finger (U1-like)-1 n=1 Tax=Phallusia mammillata TaxID=59560 RepID=A0A6F9DXT0_9ASCI|nr:ZF(U1like)-1 Zn-finger (U1-like)-1 [Phallusia mammillata]
MASYWKSQPRKYCDVCKCWIADNKASIDFHEKGKSHQEKKKKQLGRLRKQGQKQHAIDQKAQGYLKQMEKAALKQYTQDLKDNGVNIKQALHDNKIKKNSWQSKETATGKTYYWNTITEETSWSKPDDLIRVEEIKGNQLPVREKTLPTSSKAVEKEMLPAPTPPQYDSSNPLGKWTVVESPLLQNTSDDAPLQAPAQKKIKFAEKTFEQFADKTDSQVSFKKTKCFHTARNRSIRKRTSDV